MGIDRYWDSLAGLMPNVHYKLSDAPEGNAGKIPRRRLDILRAKRGGYPNAGGGFFLHSPKGASDNVFIPLLRNFPIFLDAFPLKYSCNLH